jgi:hypothetical protein
MSPSAPPSSPTVPTGPATNTNDLAEALRNFDAGLETDSGVPEGPRRFNSALKIPSATFQGLGFEGDAVSADTAEEEPGVLARAFNRLVGRDVEKDPREFSRIGTTIAGGVAGGIYGGNIPGPPVVKALGAVAGSIGGTAAGAAAPEAVLKGLEEAGLIDAKTRERMGLSTEELYTVVSGEALLDAFTLGGVSAARGLGRGMTSIMTGANRTSRSMAERATREGISLLPVQVGDGWFARRMTSVVGRFPWVAAKLKDRGERSMDQIARAFDSIPERLGPLSTFDEVSGRIMRESQATAQNLAADYEQRFRQVLSRADLNGVQIRPLQTRRATDQIIDVMNRSQGVGQSGARLAMTEGDRATLTFMNRTVRRLTDIQQTGRQAGQSGTQIADQSLRQMDSLIRTIDEQIVKAARRRDTTNVTRLETLRNAALADMTNRSSIVNRSANASQQTLQRGFDAVAEFRQIDQELTEAVNVVFASPSARKMGFQASPTGRGASIDPNRVRGVDSMAQTLLRSAAPESIREIERLVEPRTMQMLASSVFSHALEKAMPTVGEGTRRMDIDRFVKELGLDAPNSGKAAQTRELMRAAGGMTMQELDDLIEITRRASEAELPDVSTFLARSAAFQGLAGTLRAAIPFAAVTAAGTAKSMGTGLVTLTMMAGGSRLLFNMVSNPRAARAWRMVANEEARTGVRRAAYIRATGFALGEMLDAGQVSQEEYNAARHTIDTGLDELDKILKNK